MKIDFMNYKNEVYDDSNSAEYVKKDFMGKIKSVIGKLTFIENAVSMYFCALDKNTPTFVRFVAFSALAYFILPIDFAPDVSPIIGFIDDASVIAFAYGITSIFITEVHEFKAKKVMEGNFGLLWNGVL